MAIIEEYINHGTETWQRAKIQKTDEIRERIIYAYFPLYVNKKLAWLKTVKITERKYFSSVERFDDWWSYQNYWSTPIEFWDKEDIEILPK